MDADLKTIDKLIVACKENGYHHFELYHHVRGDPTEKMRDMAHSGGSLHNPIPIVQQESEAHGTDGIIVNETYKVDVNECTAVANSFSAMSNVVLPDNEQVHNMQSFAKSHKQHLHVEVTQDLMIGCAWTIPIKMCLFKCSVRFCTLIAQLTQTRNTDHFL
jgi:hypothetical protein